MAGSQPFLLRAFNNFLGREENIRSSYHALKMLSVEHERIHSGNAWLHSEEHNNLASEANLDHVIVPNSGGSIDLHLRHVGFNVTEGPGGVHVYENPYINVNSAGTDVTSAFQNRNRRATNERGFIAYENPYIDANSLGTQIDYALIEATAGGPIKAAGGDAEVLAEVILDNTKPYLVRYTNHAPTNVASYVECKMFIYRADVQ